MCVYVQGWPNVGHVGAKDKQILFNVLVVVVMDSRRQNASLIT